jgi:hypothetical protein
MSRHMRGKMSSWEATITGNSTTHCHSQSQPATWSLALTQQPETGHSS